MVSLTKRGRDTVYQAESPNMIHDPQIGKVSVYFFNLNCLFTSLINILAKPIFYPILPYVGYIVMCRCEGYGFSTVYSRTYKSELSLTPLFFVN